MAEDEQILMNGYGSVDQSNTVFRINENDIHSWTICDIVTHLFDPVDEMDEEIVSFGNWPNDDDNSEADGQADEEPRNENVNGEHEVQQDEERGEDAGEEGENNDDENEEENIMGAEIGFEVMHVDDEIRQYVMEMDNDEVDRVGEFIMPPIRNYDISSDSEDENDLHQNVAEERFDKRLSAAHSYLGQDMEAVDGNRHVVEEESAIRVPISSHYMVVVPGQTVPLTVFFPQEVMQLKRVKEANKTIGFVFSADQLKRGGIGTTAVLQSFIDVPRHSFEVVKAILQGKQRFRVKSVTRLFDGSLEADVTILPESPASHPLDAFLSPGLWRVGMAEASTQPSRVVATPAMDSTGRAFRFRISSSSRPRHRLNSRYVAAPFASHPAFLYRQYDHDILIGEIKKMFACWNTSWADELPFQTRPVEFSYWVTQTMPVSEEIKFHIMSLPHYVQRLRACHSILKTSSEMVCEICGLTITSKQHLINFSDEGSCKAFVNPGGVIHEMLTVQKVSGVRNVSSKQTDHSWFPGYAWTIIQCSVCNSHLGWKFTATKRTLHPAKFWGITRKAVRPKFEDQNWRPVY